MTEMESSEVNSAEQQRHSAVACPILQPQHGSGSVPPAQSLLFVDATGALLSYGSAPTGIPRVENFLVRAALTDPDAALRVVKFDRRRRCYRCLNVYEQRQLAAGSDAVWSDATHSHGASALRRSLRIIRENPTIGRDTDRHFADLVTRRRRRGLAYQAAKLLFRLYRQYRRGIALVEMAIAGERSRCVEFNDDVLLMSNSVVLNAALPRLMGSGCRVAFICHDLIPILYPQFAIDREHALRFAENVRKIISTPGTTVLCTSRTSATMVADYVRTSASQGASIRRFALPSILHEKAQQLCELPPQPLREPYVLYCATIEARKNHLLLARIWQQASEDGVALPRLVCVGKWGWGVEALSAYLAAHPNLASSILFTGPISDADLIAYYAHALFGVVPSYVEGWGYGASECLDFGVPVIVSTTPALIEATRGLMPAIDPDDQAAWSAEVRDLAKYADRRAALRRKIAQHYKPTASAESWAQIKGILLANPERWHD